MRIYVAIGWEDDLSRAVLEVFRTLAALDRVHEHELESDPQVADAILFVDLNEHWADRSYRVHRTHELARKYRDKVFVYNAHDQPLFVFPGIYVSGSPRWVARFRTMIGGPYASLISPSECDHNPPDLLFSFLGSRTHPVRDVVLSLDHPRALVEDTTGIDFAARGRDLDEELSVAKDRYVNAIARSKFVLCPRGFGSSSIRLFETLRAGRVPVVISDDWLMPPRVEWSNCIVRVAEADILRLPELLEERENDWAELVRAGRAARDEFSQDHLWHHYATSLSQLAVIPRRRRPWWAQRRVVRGVAAASSAWARSHSGGLPSMRAAGRQHSRCDGSQAVARR